MRVWLDIAQIFGNLYAKIAHAGKLSSDGTFESNVNYILPFEGAWTVFNGGVGMELSHSWGIIPQRYAYDFIITDDEGNSFTGDATQLASYYCYGKNIIAPADGVVVKISNRQCDSRVTGTKVFCDAWDIRGNFIVIQHAENEYSVLAHLIPGSIAVRKDDKVKQGQVIARCGNSGNTSEPHLHFQLQNGRSFFASAGLPVAFSGIAAQIKENYTLADTRSVQTETRKAQNGASVYIGRGLEVENGGNK